MCNYKSKFPGTTPRDKYYLKYNIYTSKHLHTRCVVCLYAFKHKLDLGAYILINNLVFPLIHSYSYNFSERQK